MIAPIAHNLARAASGPVYTEYLGRVRDEKLTTTEAGRKHARAMANYYRTLAVVSYDRMFAHVEDSLKP